MTNTTFEHVFAIDLGIKFLARSIDACGKKAKVKQLRGDFAVFDDRELQLLFIQRFFPTIEAILEFKLVISFSW